MARASEQKSAAKPQGQVAPSRVQHGCMRCGGLLVSDFCMDLLNGAGSLELTAKRCVQCGEVVDPVIERNRLLRQDSTVARDMESARILR